MTRSTPSYRRGRVLGSLLLLMSGTAALADDPPAPGEQCAPDQASNTSPLDRDAEANPATDACDMSSIQINPGTLTFVVIRHGEKTKIEQGQLCCTGQNRALLLPNVLVPRFTAPQQIYAPDPGDQIPSGSVKYSYVRPLATIEPTAIKQGMAVNTQIAYTDTCKLQRSLFQYAVNPTSTIFVAWEHNNINKFAAQILKTFNVSQDVPRWNNNEFDRIYVFTIVTTADDTKSTGTKSTLTFKVEHQGLNGKLAPYCATAPKWPIEVK